MKKTIVLLALLLVLLGTALVGATAPEPDYHGGITVDGEIDDWNLSSRTPFDDMIHRGGTDTKLGEAYFDYDCRNHLMYVLIIVISPGEYIPTPPSADYGEAFVKITGLGKVVGDEAGTFAWVDWDQTQDRAQGWEGSFELSEQACTDPYQVEIHTNIFDGDESQTTRAGDGSIDLCTDCTPTAVGNYVWLDENSDGYQDEGEPGLPNVRVQLKDSYGTVIATTYTDAHGGYLFDMLEPGDYYVDVIEGSLPAGMSQTPPSTLPGADFGNQDHGGNGYLVSVGGSNPTENLTADFGYNWNPKQDVDGPTGPATATIGDRVWVDADGDGVQDPEEVGIEGVTVTLTGAGPDGKFGTTDDTTTTTTTDANGSYIFDGLDAGVYAVEVTSGVPSGYDQTGDPDHFGADSSTAAPGTAGDDKTTTPIVLAPGDVFLNADFGYKPTGVDLGSIGDKVWLDADGDGVGPDGNGGGSGDDDSEIGIPGVTVALIKDLDGDGIWDRGTEPIIATDTTDAQGDYLFEGLPVGASADYLVWVNDTDNVLGELMPTYDQDGEGGSGGNWQADSVLGLSSRQNLDTTPVLDHDFGYAPAGHTSTEGLIGDTIYIDAGGDGGVYNPAGGDTPIEGVLVELYDSTGTVLLGAAVTNENGSYTFGNLGAGTYVVKVPTSNFDSGAVLEGMSNSFDPDGATANESTVTIGGAQPLVNLEQDFGFSAPAQTVGVIGDWVWYDRDGDGSGPGSTGTDMAEKGIPGVLVNLYDDSANPVLIAQAYTDADGYYLFTGLPVNETYTVQIDGSNFASGGPLEGLSNTFDRDDGTTSPDSQSTVTLSTASPIRMDQDFGYRGEGRNSIGNYVWGDLDSDGVGPDVHTTPGGDNGEPGLAGVTVRLYNDGPDGIAGTADDVLVATQVTDPSGLYLFDDLPDDTYTVVVDPSTLPAGWTTPPTGDPDSADDGKTTVPVSGGTHYYDADFGYPPAATPLYSIGDTIWFDVNNSGGATPDYREPRLPGVTVKLKDSSGAVIATTTTDADGTYVFDGLPAGDYTVEVDTSTLPSYVSASPSYDPNGGGDSQATVTVNNGNPHPRNMDFSYPPETTGGTGQIGNLIWEDVNADGVYQADGADGIPGTADDEAPIGGVTVDLYRDLNGNGAIDPGEPRIATTTSGATISSENGPDGNYLFSGLPEGDYVVDVSDRDGVLGGYWHSLGASGVDNNSQVDPYAVQLGGGEPIDDYSADFGYYAKPAALGNWVWEDVNKNGIQDDGETGINGVEVTLEIEYPDGTTITYVTVTANDPVDGNPGWYSFGNLLLDEDYNSDGTGAGGSEPSYTISIDLNQPVLSEFSPTLTGKGNPLNDSNNHGGTNASVTQGVDEVQRSDDNTPPASYDFGFAVMPTGVTLRSLYAVPQGGAIEITWSTATETDLLGFNLYRSEGIEGVPVHLNEITLQAQNLGSPLGAGYSYLDQSAVKGVTYAYWLELIDVAGATEQHGPVIARVPDEPGGFQIYLPLTIYVP